MFRQAIISIIVGKRNSGKSYYTVKKVIPAAVKTKKVLIVDTIDHEKYREFQIIKTDAQIRAWKSGVKRFITNPVTLKEDIVLLNKLSNCLIIFEDATKYFTINAPRELFLLLYDSKQKSIDIILMFHGFKNIMNEILANANYITLFKIEENIKRYENKIPRYDYIERVHKLIQLDMNQYINRTIQIAMRSGWHSVC